jgi:predicted P-loop ATPase
MTTTDTTHDFEHLLNQHKDRAAARNGVTTPLTDDEFADLMTAAETARTAASWMWPALTKLLKAAGGYKAEKELAEDVKRVKVMAALGAFPYRALEFVDIWCKLHAYESGFIGAWTQNGRATRHDTDYILNTMMLDAADLKLFNRDEIKSALSVWERDAETRIQAATYDRVKFDPTADPGQTELRKFVDMFVGGADDPEELETIKQTAMIAYSTFIYRVKNHLRDEMKAGEHLMCVLQGTQGDGKTEGVKRLMKPLGDTYTGGGFDVFHSDSMGAKLAKMSVLIFEEMSGAPKADIMKIKETMTAETKLFNEKYKVAGVQRVVTTFIGCSNKDIRNLFKDETGNRRFIQFTVADKVPFEVINAPDSFDALKIWRSVDEDAVASPMNITAENQQMIAAMQAEQRVMGAVENWITEDHTIPWGIQSQARDLFNMFFVWAQNGGMSKAELNFWDKRRLTGDLKELAQTRRYIIKHVFRSRIDYFTLERPADDTATPREQANYHRLKATIERKEAVAQTIDARKWSEVERETESLMKRDAALNKIIKMPKG